MDVPRILFLPLPTADQRSVRDKLRRPQSSDSFFGEWPESGVSATGFSVVPRFLLDSGGRVGPLLADDPLLPMGGVDFTLG